MHQLLSYFLFFFLSVGFIFKVEEWYLDESERDNLLYKFRFGYLKLAPISPPRSTDNNAFVVRPGLVSAPIGLQWLWPLAKGIPISATFSPTEQAERLKFVEKKATEMCHEWYEEDGAQYNFIRYTETNASCPCVESQAIMDLGRFMPHPRCSQVFRDISCSTMIGANNCYMSAQNIYSSYYAGDNDDFNSKNTAPFPTHYGQVCCYDAEGKLMQSNYVPVIKVIEQTPYNPGYPVRAYEFGTYPYMGQYEVPGFSTFYHDTMPYFFCCKYAKFRCQLFYWRRPTSGCQEYRSAAAGYVQGAAAFETIDNQKFIFDEPGVFTLLHISKTLTNPEVRVQIRLERYPNRRVDFGLLGRYLSQADLVQPTNATVVTGVALEASGTDRVVVVVRKDTRRFRYRTSIIVGNIIRYFDNMRIQRFRGVMVYVNNVERGQAEVYVVLEEAEVGVRIRESYALDITRLPMYQESMGLLDVKLSISPKYGVRPNADSSEYITIMDGRRFPRVYGLMRPSADGNPLLNDVSFGLNSVNAESVRKELINNYKILGSGEPGSKQPSGVSNSGTPTDNMFTTSLDDDRRYEVYPEAALKRLPIYKTARKFDQYPYQFVAKTGSNLSNLIQQCTDLEKNPQKDYKMELQLLREYGSSPCPEAPTAITSLCGDNIPCLNDYTLLRSKVLGIEALNNWDNFLAERRAGSKHYNSCGAIMIEYPSYMLKTPSMTSGYLEGDTASFSCYQTHWIKGDYDYKCSKTYSSDSADYLFGWNKGWQPWCRSRELDNLLKWLTAIFSTIGIIMFLIIVFAAFWSIKQRRRKVDDMNRVQYSSRKGFDPRRFNIREDDAKRGRKTASETNGDLGRHAEREERRSMGVTSTNKVTSPERLSPPELRSRGQLPRDLPFMGFNTSV
ncbi:hypothetical protein AB6A40_005985 [Gnathostoma spinigerum]|uniref:AMOP domain-containing protein n=1 Tax=Gnathostoma spinigerum TaxID=75299 RepID=A0ABD6EJ42_9BILA